MTEPMNIRIHTHSSKNETNKDDDRDTLDDHQTLPYASPLHNMGPINLNHINKHKIGGSAIQTAQQAKRASLDTSN